MKIDNQIIQWHKNNGMLKIEDYTKRFLPNEISSCFRSMDGSDVAEWLSFLGYKILKYYDTGRNGLVVTTCGYSVSTNGYVYKTKRVQDI